MRFEPTHIELTQESQTWIKQALEKQPDLLTDRLENACRFMQLQTPEQYNHGLAIANALLPVTADSTALAAALIYPVYEQLEALTDQEKEALGKSVCKLVSGAHKITAVHILHHPVSDPAEEQIQIDKLRKMLLAIVDDIRIVLVKLAERIVECHRIKNAPEPLQKKIASEIMSIYAPLANRLGMGHLKWQLEDLAFRYLNHETYLQISKALNMRRTERENFIAEMIDQLKKLLSDVYIKEPKVTGRAKHIYSIYRKMSRKNVDLNQLYDTSALRILVPNIADCYTALGLVHTAWQHIPAEFDDYIANPKPNAYRSIHTAVIGPNHHPIEIQIRSFQMHEEAELGFAAHWIYKEGRQKENQYEKKIAWLREVIDWQKDLSEKESENKVLLQSLFEDQIYVFTPRGQVIDLPKDATALDFAYRIHTDLGHRCRGARINGKLEPLTKPLATSDCVEIIVGKVIQPSRDWLVPQYRYMITHRALQKVRHFFKQDLDSPLTEAPAAIKSTPQPMKLILSKAPSHTNDLSVFLVEGEKDLLTHMAQCCKPIPGDPILGFITRGRGITIHKDSCKNILALFKTAAERIVHVVWSETTGTYPVDILLHAKNTEEHTLIKDVLGLMSNLGYKLSALQTQQNKHNNIISLKLTTRISDQSPLEKILAVLKQLPAVISAERAE